MAELLLELYSEEIPPKLQIDARNQFKILIKKSLEENNIKYGNLQIYSSPTRLTLYINDLPNEIKIKAQEIKGPKVGAPENILDSFARAKEVSKKELFEKKTEKGKFFFF